MRGTARKLLQSGLPLGLGVMVLGWPSVLQADLLIRQDGGETQGDLLSMDSSEVRFREQGGAESVVPRHQLARLELYRDLSGTTETKVERLSDPILQEAMTYVVDAESYPDAGAVNLYLGYHLTYEADWSSTTQVRNIVRILHERGKGEGTVSASWLRDIQDFEFDFGRTYLPDGSIKGLTGKGVRVSAVNTTHPEYDRQMRQLQTLPAVDVGRVVDWQYTRRSNNRDPAFPPFYDHVIRLGEPVMRGVLVMRIHKDLQADLILTRTEGVSRRRTMDGDYRVETFEWVGMEPGPREDHRPPGAEIYPTVYLAPRATWEEVSESLRPSVEKATEAGPLATQLVKKLVPEGTPEDEVYQILALWVAREIRLVGVLMENFRFAPRPLEEILSTGTGNYLDKTMALHGLLRVAGVESELHLARDRFRSPMPEGVRALELFNDALVRIKLNGEWVFRTPDDKDLDPFVLPSVFYDTHSLRVSGTEPAKDLTQVAAPPLEDDLLRVRYTTTLEADGTLMGERDLLVRGNSARTVRSYRNLAGDQLKMRMESLNHGFHPSSELLGYELRNLADFTKDVSYRRQFKVPGYALKAGGKLLAFRLPGLVGSSSDVGNSMRWKPIAFQRRDLEETEIQVALPPGFRVLHLPQAISFEGAGYAFHSSLEEKAGMILFQSRFDRSTFRIAPEDYPAYKQMRDQRARLARQWIVVERQD